MISPSLNPLRRRARHEKSRRSSALIITLAIIAVLTVLLLAFLTRAGMERQISGASAAETKADAIAKSGLDLVVTDFRQEIAAGSTVTANTTNYPSWPIYLPVSANTSIPARILASTETNNFNLVRRSMTNAAFTSAVTTAPLSAYYSQYNGNFPTNNLASSPNCNTTANPSANGRSISATRWNHPQLLNEPANFVSPDWVLVTRNGPQVFTAWNSSVANTAPANTNYVIGRYAYTVYDEGGLLDANVVGRLSTVPTPPIGKTTVAAMADLTQLNDQDQPVWAATTSVAAQSSVDTFVGWRNASTSTSPYNSSNPQTNTTYFGFVTGTTNSFLQAKPGNQAFLTRQDLINSITAGASGPAGSLGAAGFTTNALPFLATFTRQINAPSFYPALSNFSTSPVNNATTSDSTSRPKVGSGGGAFSIPSYDTADVATTAIPVRKSVIVLDNQNYGTAADMMNPALADVRFPISGTLPDGTTVTKGQPLLRKKFALSRLALLTSSNSTVSSTTPTDQTDLIYRYFGLTRSAATYTTSSGTYVSPWTYNHGGPAGSILTLEELQADIAAGTIAPRDPDFFELLQAGIATGSLGRDAANPSSTGDSGWGMMGTGDTVAPSAATPAPSQTDESLTNHILQIGANIIDQANPRYDPISISIGSSPGVTVFGQEDLPCINKILPFICPDSPTSGTDSISGWYLFELWNPYQVQNSTSNNPQLRLTGNPPNGTASSAYLNIKINNNSNQYLSYPSVDFTAAGSGTNYISFTPSASTTFSAPEMLTQTNTVGIASPVARNIQSAGETLNGTSYTWAGIYAGNITNAPTVYPTTAVCESWEIAPGTTSSGQENGSNKNFTAGFATFALQCLTSNGAWQTYNICRDLYATKNSTGSSLLNNPPSSGVGYFYAKLDPRTDRWSSCLDENVAIAGGGSKFGTTWLSSPSGGGYNPKLVGYYWGPQESSGFSQPGTQSGPTPSGNYWSLNENNPANPYTYVDPDGVVRMGDELYMNSLGDAMSLASSGGVNIYPSRPLLLHRPLQSVADLGYVFRDIPWKSLDFNTSRSGDSALLDVFSAYEEPTVVAGKVDVNTRNAPVLAALISGGCIDELGSSTGTSTPLSSTESINFAKAIVGVSEATPFHNKSDLVNRIMGSLAFDTTSTTPTLYDTWGAHFSSSGLTLAQKQDIKMNREAPIRALSEATASRTWNFMIDIIAQSGRYTSSSASLADFTVDGEKRYWLHVAIDRYTGKIVDEQLEPVYE